MRRTIVAKDHRTHVGLVVRCLARSAHGELAGGDGDHRLGCLRVQKTHEERCYGEGVQAFGYAKSVAISSSMQSSVAPRGST